MKTIRLILGDQLNFGISSLSDINPNKDLILMAELNEEATYVKHHKKKIAFIFSAMRHFAEQCRQKGWNVCYIKYDSSDNKGNFIKQIQYAISNFSCDKLCMTEAGEYRLRQEFEQLNKKILIPFEIRKDTRFFCNRRNIQRMG